MNIQNYMSRGVLRVVTDALRSTAKNEKERLFMTRFAKAAAAAGRQRYASEKKGEHIPPFLIASITSACNLHCAGCYSRSNHACTDEAPAAQLTGEEWGRIFAEAEELGVSFILLAGGEPMLRFDVLQRAAAHETILFPVFTNGTYLHEKYLQFLDEHRNILPILSIEGDQHTTDERRGEGVYKQVTDSMRLMEAKGIPFGASVTVTTENMKEVFSSAFLDRLYTLGCRAVIYVEFVPVTEKAAHLAPDEAAQDEIIRTVKKLRRTRRNMVFIAFPGDEKKSGGCVAAGRGFFHINSHGGAEPCPFSPYSDINVKETSLREALSSPLFRALQTQGLLLDDHIGGCTLYARKDEVEAILRGEK